MNKNTLIGLFLGLIIAGAGLTYVVTNSGEDAMPSTPNNSETALPADMSEMPENLQEVIKKAISRQPMEDVVVLDVRTDEEWNELHAKDAIHWGLAEHLESGNLPPLGKNMEIYVYCRTGNRSGQAIKIMQAAGYTNLTNIGGLDDWVAANGETAAGIDGDNQ